MSTKKTSPESASDREIVMSRVYDAPRALVWEAWTNPEHVAKWWGPRGFSTTIKKMDFRVGGTWEHVMRGPDGVNYPNKSTFKEIVPQERIAFTHGGGRETGPGATFNAVWTFETVEGDKTRLTGRLIFPTPEARDFVAKEFGAVEGGKQTLERLSEHLPAMQSRGFELNREFAAPRQLVWDAWTKPEHLARWFGPKGFTVSVATFNLQPGGEFLYKMLSPDGRETWLKWTFKEIVPPGKLVVVVSFSDAKGDAKRHPMIANWPLAWVSTVTFSEQDGRTRFSLRSFPINASEEERQAYEAGQAGMSQGWDGTMERLTAHLAEMRKDA